MSRRTANAAAGFLCGMLLCGACIGSGDLVIPVCIGILGVSLFLKDRARLFAVTLSVGALLYLTAYTSAEKTAALEGQSLVLECKVAAEYGNDKPFYVCETVFPDGTKGKIGLYVGRDSGYEAGDRFTASGKLMCPTVNKSYYTSRSVFLVMFRPHIENVHPQSGFMAAVSSFRSRVCGMIRGISLSDPDELVISALFGSRASELSEDSKEALRAAGLGHITAVSGLHLSVVAAFAAGLAGRRKKLRFLFGTAAGLMVCVLSGFALSAVRAFIMLAVLLFAPVAKRRSDPLTSLMIAAALIVVSDPLCVTDVSFVLSVAGVMGAGVIPAAIEHFLEQEHEKKAADDEPFCLPAPIRTLLSVVFASLCASFAGAVFFDEVSVISPLSNLLLSPIISAEVGISYLSAALSPVFPELSSFLFMVCRILAAVILRAAFFGASLFPAVPSPHIILLCTAGAVSLGGTILSRSKKTAICIFAASVFLAFSFQCAYELIRPDTVLFEEGLAAAEGVSRDGNVFVNGEDEKTLPFEKADVIICMEKLFPYYRKYCRNAVLIDIDKPETYSVGGWSVSVNEGRVTIEKGDAYGVICR